MWQETIKIDGPYNFESCLKKHDFDPLKRINVEERSITMPLLAEGSSHVVEIIGVGTTDEPQFIVKADNKSYKQQIINKVSEIFQWEVSLKPIHEHFHHTDLKDIFNQYYGTPLLIDFDPFGCLVRCIIFQQLNMAFAATLTDRFIKGFGYEINGAWFYPKPETVANLSVEKLRELQFSNRKAEYVIDLAKHVVNGDLDIESLKSKSDEDIFKELIKIRGIGKWTIENFLLFGLGRPNLFPMADIGIQNALKKLYQLEKKPTTGQMENFKQGWEPYLSYASLYLWRSIE